MKYLFLARNFQLKWNKLFCRKTCRNGRHAAAWQRPPRAERLWHLGERLMYSTLVRLWQWGCDRRHIRGGTQRSTLMARHHRKGAWKSGLALAKQNQSLTPTVKEANPLLYRAPLLETRSF